MNIVNNRYPSSYGYGSSRLLEPRPAILGDRLDPYARERLLLDRPEVPPSRSYLNCPCGLPMTAAGDHLCRSCIIATHTARQVLNIRGGDHCDCSGCSLANDNDDRDLDLLERYGGYYSAQ